MADVNGTMMQYFQWYSLTDGTYWEEVKDKAAELASAGITALWLPPAYKESAEEHDLFDLGDCDQEGTVRTKSGTREQYLAAIKALQGEGIQVYADAVLNEQMQGELSDWGKGYLDTTRVDGFRLDASKPISTWFLTQWIDQMREHAEPDLFIAGEFGSTDVNTLHEYISNTGGRLSIFDVPLHQNFHRASRAGGYFDMRQILDGTLMQQQPNLAVTFVENHNSQPLQVLESPVEPWFKPLAYALILLRREGYPCVFYADYYGAHYSDRGHEIWMDCHRWLIDKFLYARKHYAYGPQYDYFNQADVIGWTRLGDTAHPYALAVIMSDGWGGSRWMEVGKPSTTFHDLTEHLKEPVYTNEHGWGEFRCKGGSVSVWIEERSLQELLKTAATETFKNVSSELVDRVLKGW